jgi:tyrosinase
MQCTIYLQVTQTGGQTTTGACTESVPFCGVRDQMYPDRRSMGYPFDRLPRANANTLTQFLTPNMGVADVTIRFQNTVNQNPASAAQSG